MLMFEVYILCEMEGLLGIQTKSGTVEKNLGKFHKNIVSSL